MRKTFACRLPRRGRASRALTGKPASSFLSSRARRGARDLLFFLLFSFFPCDVIPSGGGPASSPLRRQGISRLRLVLAAAVTRTEGRENIRGPDKPRPKTKTPRQKSEREKPPGSFCSAGFQPAPVSQGWGPALQKKRPRPSRDAKGSPPKKKEKKTPSE